MSIKLMTRVWEHPALQDITTAMVALALADWANDQGICWPSHQTIARRARISDRQVRRVLEEMENTILEGGVHLLEIEHNRGRNKTNRYKLNLTQCPVLAEPESPSTSNDEVSDQDSENLTPCPVLEQIKQDTGDSENRTYGTENRTSATVKPDIAMSDEPSGTVSKKQPSLEPCARDHEAIVFEIATTHPGNEHLRGPRRPLPQDLEIAIVEAVLRDGEDLVLAGTRNLAQKVAVWPPGDERFIPNAVKFYRFSEYLKNPMCWDRSAKPSAKQRQVDDAIGKAFS